MVRRILILAAAAALTAACNGEPVAPESVCPEGMVLFPSWQGEYPGPVIQVSASVELPMFGHPCDQSPDRRCMLEPGLYHPWGSGEAFATLRPARRYLALEPFTLEEFSVQAGETIEAIGYLGENYCSWKVRDTSLTAECLFEGNYPLEALPAPGEPERQFFKAGCDGWILVDQALLDHTGVTEGRVLGYGAIGPATSD